MPGEPKKNEYNRAMLIGAAVPVVLCVVMVEVTKEWLYALFMITSPVMLLSQWMGGRKKGGKSQRQRTPQYRDKMAKLAGQLVAVRGGALGGSGFSGAGLGAGGFGGGAGARRGWRAATSAPRSWCAGRGAAASPDPRHAAGTRDRAADRRLHGVHRRVAPGVLPEECAAVLSWEMPGRGAGTTVRSDGVQYGQGAWAVASHEAGRQGRTVRPFGIRMHGSGLERVPPLLADQVSVAWANRVARALAPVRDVSRDDAQSMMPNSARLLDLIGMPNPSPELVLAAWQRRGRTTKVPIGIGADGRFIHDVSADGPDALVAGTTGAGKSPRSGYWPAPEATNCHRKASTSAAKALAWWWPDRRAAGSRPRW